MTDRGLYIALVILAAFFVEIVALVFYPGGGCGPTPRVSEQHACLPGDACEPTANDGLAF